MGEKKDGNRNSSESILIPLFINLRFLCTAKVIYLPRMFYFQITALNFTKTRPVFIIF